MLTGTVILAAGRAQRLGGISKPLLRSRGELLAARSLRTALQAGTVPVLVLGHRAEQVGAALKAEVPGLAAQAQFAVVPEGRSQLAESFRTGVRRAAGLGADRIAVLLVDQPGITAAALAAALEGHTAGRIIRGAVQGRAGHPVVMATAEAAAAAELAEGDEGARRYLHSQAGRVDTVDLTGLAEDADIDTPEDLALLTASALQRAGQRRSGPW
ncbi:nucleotidyltransferase family protein [Nesterenkonia alkaliphila]|uniref:nucleotidyltransferase family protein n=1 Tax=Nesterenkonia alkaliphila TaxID=1463631 RepID=UPI0012F8B00E|nr:NTP transferase domain-containing protein [Nesterenkonia alkaliphila]GFZ76836.1 4-diphosphocytidyl-2C-methyl-D-erythritol synthase [Nesterenkonia alkaliphila]